MISDYERNLRCRKRDENGDIIWGHGSDDYVTGLDAMAEVIRSRLQAVQGEWWEGDVTAIPYYDEIISAYQTKQNQAMIDLMVIDRIMDTRGVLSVSNVFSEIRDRKYTFRCTVNTVYGTTPAEVIL